MSYGQYESASRKAPHLWAHLSTTPRRHTALIVVGLAVVSAFLLPVSTAAAKRSSTTVTGISGREPTLGARDAFGAIGKGFGQVRPREIDVTGDFEGHVLDITWHSWGGPRATGTGRGLWVPRSARSLSQGKLAPVAIVAFDLGPCSGRYAYRSVEWYFPQHGQSFNPSYAIGPSSLCPPPTVVPTSATTSPTTKSESGLHAIYNTITFTGLDLVSGPCDESNGPSGSKCFSLQQNYFVADPRPSTGLTGLNWVQNAVLISETKDGSFRVVPEYEDWWSCQPSQVFCYTNCPFGLSYCHRSKQSGKQFVMSSPSPTKPVSLTLASYLSDGTVTLDATLSADQVATPIGNFAVTLRGLSGRLEMVDYDTPQFNTVHADPPEFVMVGEDNGHKATFGRTTSGDVCSGLAFEAATAGEPSTTSGATCGARSPWMAPMSQLVATAPPQEQKEQAQDISWTEVQKTDAMSFAYGRSSADFGFFFSSVSA